MLVIGIDPGVNGAIALVGDRYAEVHDAPTEQPGKRRRMHATGVVQVLRRAFLVPEFAAELRTTTAHLEYAATRPDEAAALSFVFGDGWGIYRGALAALDIPVNIVTPKKWKGAMGLSSDKRLSLALARRLFPGLAGMLAREKDHGRAEALLIAHWARGCFVSSATRASPLHVEQPELDF